MSVTASRVAVWVLAVISLVLLIKSGAAMLAKPGFFTLEFLAFALSNVAYIKCIQVEQKLKEKNDD